MSLNTIGKLFMPKNTVFYELFENVATTVEEMAGLFKTFVEEGDASRRRAILSQLEQLEHKNDDHTHTIFTELGRNFITPFDREDVHYLASSLDDIADQIYGAAKRITFYNVDPSDSGIRTIVDIILAGSTEVKTAVYGLRDMKNLKRMTDAMIKVNSLENQADDVYDFSIEKLFENENDIKLLIKRREIYKVLEKATDKIEDAANAIETIIVKYA